MNAQSSSIFLALLTLQLVINSAERTSQHKVILYDSIDREVEKRNEISPLPSISERDIEEAFKRAESSLVQEMRLHHGISRRQLDGNSTGCRNTRKVKPEVVEIGRNSEIIARAVEILRTTQNLTRDVTERIVKRTSVRPNINLNTLCQQRQFRCNPNAKFRNLDGSCNNLGNPEWGMSVHRMNRIIAPQYGDGFGSPRLNSRGRPLPLSRFVSSTVIPDINVNSPLAHISMFFGQFTDHDITSTPHRTDLTNCCSNQNNADCLPLRIPNNDPVYSNFRIGCMEFSRSIRACGTGVREQMNQNTAFIDGSQIYGSNSRETQALRAFQGGLLLAANNGADLPFDSNTGDFRAGDDRVNEHPGLISIHNIFMREHNRIARALRNLAPSFSDDKLFEESKRVLIAELQAILYGEYLPVILGPDAMKEFELSLPSSGGATLHRANVDPSILNSFATAAFRFGHSLIQNRHNLGRSGSFLLKDNFNDPSIVHRNGIEPVLIGGVQQNAQNMDNFVAEAVTNFLFKESQNQIGLDLAAFNIERGREHGLPGYNAYREACGLPRISNFNDLDTVFGDSRAPGAFSQAYENVNDIDLWPAGVAERSVPGGTVGPTFACILGTQFHRLLYGDRHFFTHDNQPGSFTADERNMLKRRTIASIICDNTNIESIQVNAFLVPSSSNPAISCSRHPKIDFRIFF